jgi:CubicO group peptidase (beta-lactamase class C family)
LQAVLKSALGEKDYAEFPWSELFNKIGMKSAVLERDQSNVFVGSSYLHTTGRDLAKLGLLYLNDGVWNGQRILPQGWVFWSNQIVPAYRQFSSDIRGEKLTPGYHVWLNRADTMRGIQKVLPDVPEDTFAASGHWGQSMWMIPSQRLIVVRFADDRDRSFSANRFLRLLLNSLSNPLTAERNRP